MAFASYAENAKNQLRPCLLALAKYAKTRLLQSLPSKKQRVLALANYAKTRLLQVFASKKQRVLFSQVKRNTQSGLQIMALAQDFFIGSACGLQLFHEIRLWPTLFGAIWALA